MITALKIWWRNRIIKRSPVTEEQWIDAFSSLPFLQKLPDSEQVKLRELAIIFLHQKTFSGALDLTVTDSMARLIALQACLPILNLGISWYRGWVSVIIYPAGFAPERDVIDENGLVRRVKQSLSGEAWQRGPVVLSWEASEEAGKVDGRNVVIHEFVHKLDMLNGSANGFPPMHGNLDQNRWTKIFTIAYDDFQSKVQQRNNSFDAYAATSPAEFIAVFSEVFFEKPDILKQEYPLVYEQFQAFFQLDPLQWITSA